MINVPEQAAAAGADENEDFFAQSFKSTDWTPAADANTSLTSAQRANAGGGGGGSLRDSAADALSAEGGTIAAASKKPAPKKIGVCLLLSNLFSMKRKFYFFSWALKKAALAVSGSSWRP